MKFFIFHHSNLSTNPYFCTLTVHCEKWVYFYWKNNYISIFIIKLLMFNQFQILNLISFIIHYRRPKKGHSTKVGIVTQKVKHFSVHSPSNLFWPLWLSFHKLVFCAFMHGKIPFGFWVLESCVYKKPCFQIVLT